MAVTTLDSMRQKLGAWIAGSVGKMSEPFTVREEGSSSIDIWGVERAPGKGDLVDSYKGTAYACANLCAQGVAATPLRLYVTTGKGQTNPKVPTRGVSRKDKARLAATPVCGKQVVAAANVEEVLAHPILDLLDTVNAELDGFTLLEITDLYLEVVGSAYWYLPRDPLGRVEAIWILQSQYVNPKRNDAGRIVAYEYGSQDSKAAYSVDTVLPFYFPNLSNPYAEGWSPLRAAYESVMLEEKNRAQAAALLENNARPDLLVSAKGEGGGLGDHEADRLERRFRRKFHRGSQGGIAVISDEVDITPISFPPKDVQAMLLHGMTKEDIANAYGVPMSLLATKDVNRANAEAGHYQLAKNAILPRCRRLEQRLSQRFCPLFDERLFLAFDDPVPEDNAFALQRRQVSMQTGTLTINEARAEDGREPVDGGDDTLIPMSMIPLTDAGPPEPPPAPEPPPKEDGDEEGEDEEPASAPKRAKAKVRRHARRLPRGRALAQTLRWQFRKQQTAALKRFKAITKAAWVPPPEMFDDMNWKAWDEEMARASQGHLVNTAMDGAGNVSSQLAQRFPDEFSSWTVAPVRIEEAMARSSMSFSHATNQTTHMKLDEALAKLRQDLAAGIVGPENTVSTLTQMVKGVFREAETYRAQRIAVTESNRAIHEGERIAAKECGMVKGFRWLLSGDACEQCQAVAARMPEVDLNSPFAIDDAGGPYAEIYHPPLHPNCQCSMMEVFI